jgi:hypothetical protein
MSQYPSPYTPPPSPNYGGYDFNYYQPMQDPLAPAKKASIMLYVLGALVLLPSMCCGLVGLSIPTMIAQQPAAFSELSASGMTPQAMQTVLIVGGVVGLLIAVAMIVLGRFVRRGSAAPAVTAIVLVALIGLYLLLNAIGLLVMKMPPAQVVMGMAITVLGLVLIGMLILWLIQAVMAAPRVALMKNQYQQQMWQYQQQQQMYQQRAYAAQQQQPPTPPSDGGSPGDPNAPSA